jgi:hypothetical protein
VNAERIGAAKPELPHGPAKRFRSARIRIENSEKNA